MSSSTSSQAPEQTGAPLLTIAIPTYNRARFLAESLAVLGPQIQQLAQQHPGEVELLISDNASVDATANLLDATEQDGLPLRRLLQPENIGSDRNFVACFRAARGRYFWLCGDDDILRPGAVAAVLDAIRHTDYDWIFLPPEPFHTDWQAEFRPDPYRRTAQVVTSAREMALRVNVMVTFISGNVVNRERLLALHVEPPEQLVGTHLTQLAWTLPLLRDHRRSLILWQRYVAGRRMNSGGYSVGEVFGEGFVTIVHRLLPDQPRIAAIFTDIALRQWFPATLVELRDTGNGSHFELQKAGASLRRTFGRNFRFWLFTWPVMRLPLPLAKLWNRAGTGTGRIVRLIQLPSDMLYKLTHRRIS